MSSRSSWKNTGVWATPASVQRRIVTSRRRGVEVDERDLAPLTGELLDQRAADAGRPARDEHAPVGERRVGGEVLHDVTLTLLPLTPWYTNAYTTR